MPEPPKTERVSRTPAEAETALGGAAPDTAVGYGPLPAATFNYAPPPVVLSSRYEILAELGQGGMGIVYKARDRETSELLALKVLRPEIAARAEIAERFKSELRLARQITHKNVCRIYDFNRIAGERGDVACISMELVEGESLRHVLERFGNLSVRASVRIAAQICAALREAHAQGIVHRDMKPENVMLDARGDVKVMDFGIAQSMAPARDGTTKSSATEGGISGTPAYMSPEQAQGQPTDARTDVYAVGMILYEMLSGSLPFKGKTTLELARRGEPVTPEPLRELEPTVPAHLERIALRCLERDVERRYPSVAELEAALRAEAPAEIVEFEIPVPERLRTFAAADRVLIAAAVVGLLLLLTLWPRVVPAGSKKLQIDEVSARREALQWLQRLGQKDPRMVAELQYDAKRYRTQVANLLFHRDARADMLGELRKIDFPLRWRIDYGSPAWVHGLLDPDGYLVLNRDGTPIEYVQKVQPYVEFLPTYQPPPAEKRRAIAAAIGEQMCGQPLAGVPHSELAGGPWNATYEITWQRLHPPGAPPAARVSLWAEKPVEVHCAGSEPVFAELPPLRDIMSSAGMAFVFVAFGTAAVWFVLGRCYTSPLALRRGALALVLAPGFAWIICWEFFGSPPWWAIIALTGALALALVVGFLALEHRMLRFRPGLLATWELVWRGKVLDAAVGAAVLRGAAMGLFLAGAQAGVAELTHLALRNPVGRIFAEVALGMPDPTGAGLAVASSFPVLFVGVAVIYSAIEVGFAAVAYGILSSIKWLRRAEEKSSRGTRLNMYLSFLLGACASVGLLAVGLRSEFAPALSAGMGFMTISIALALPLVLVAMRYDLVTASFAAGTTTLFTLNTTVIALLNEVGNTGNQMLFLLWGGVVAAALVVTFRGTMMERLQRFRAEQS